jgi:hemerythrin
MNALPAPCLTWNDGFVLGYAPMDEVHEEFVDLIGALGAADRDALPAALAELAEHAHAHFADEERWMTETGFPARECHAAEHAAVLASIEGVARRVAQGDHAAARRLAQALTDWFPAHADYLDAALAHWMCKLRLGGKPVVLRRHLEIRPA